MIRHIKRHGKPQHWSFENVTNYDIPESGSPHEFHLRLLKGRQLLRGTLRLSAVLLAVAETALELIIIVNEITYIVIIDQEMPSDHYHLHLGHDSVVPQLCSSNVTNYSWIWQPLRITLASDEGKTTPSNDVMLVCCSACRSTLFLLGGRRATDPLTCHPSSCERIAKCWWTMH